MYIIFLAIVLSFIVFASVNGALDIKKTKETIVTEKAKCKDYTSGIITLWSTTVAVIIMCIIGSISVNDLGFRPISFNYNIWFTVITLILSGLAFLFFIYQFISSLVRLEWLEKQIKGISEGAIAVLPRTKKEKRLFVIVALSAGICEEILYRGFLVFLLMTIFPDMPVYLIIIISGVLFGISHFYQGLTGIIHTGLVGTLFMCLFLATGSLFLPMLLHFIMDVAATFALPEEQVKEISSD